MQHALAQIIDGTPQEMVTLGRQIQSLAGHIQILRLTSDRVRKPLR
jgi:hypothetical protein